MIYVSVTQYALIDTSMSETGVLISASVTRATSPPRLVFGSSLLSSRVPTRQHCAYRLPRRKAMFEPNLDNRHAQPTIERLQQPQAHRKRVAVA